MFCLLFLHKLLHFLRIRGCFLCMQLGYMSAVRHFEKICYLAQKHYNIYTRLQKLISFHKRKHTMQPYWKKKEQSKVDCSFCIVDEYCNFVDKLTVSEYKFLLLHQVVFTAFVQVNCLASIVHFAHINSTRTYLCRVGSTCPFARSSRRGRHAR